MFRAPMAGAERAHRAGLSAEDAQECRDGLRVKLGPGPALEFLHCPQRASRAPVGTIGHNRPIRVGDQDHAGEDRDRFASQAIRIPGPVLPLVAVPDG